MTQEEPLGTRPPRQGENAPGESLTDAMPERESAGRALNSGGGITSGTGAVVLPASRGWSTQIDGEYEEPKGTIGVVVAQKFPDPEIIRVKLEEGFARVSPDTVWVMRDGERKGHAANFAWQTFRSHGIEPFLAPLVPYFQTKKRVVTAEFVVPDFMDECEQAGTSLSFTEHVPGGTDNRAGWRDSELRSTCERIIVFHDKSSGITADWLEYRDNHMSRAKIFVIERGNVKVKRYKTGRALS